jgi:RNA polymerase sigma-70 factor (ECF subfamily)
MMPGPDPGLEGFERLLRETHRTVFQVAYALLANAADAEEVTQDAFLRAYRKFSSLRDPQKFRAWVARMCWRLALNRRRANFRALQRDGAWFRSRPAPNDPEAEASAREFESRVQEHIAGLPEKLRSALLLSAVQGLDARTVGMILKVPEATVRSRVFLARRQLLKTLLP